MFFHVFRVQGFPCASLWEGKEGGFHGRQKMVAKQKAALGYNMLEITLDDGRAGE